MGGGLFWRLETKSKDLDPDFDWSSLKLRRFSAQIQVISKKKVFTKIESTELFSSMSHQVLDQISSPIPLGGAIFDFSAKISLKSAKNKAFCIQKTRHSGFVILAVIPESVLRVCGAHLLVIAPGQHILHTKNKALWFRYTRCNTRKRVTSLRSSPPRHCARATKFLSKKCHSGDGLF